MIVNYEIRQAQKDDIGELCKLHRQILISEGVSHLISEEQLINNYTPDSLSNHFILIVNREIVSHIEVKECCDSYAGFTTLKYGELRAVHTHEAYRGYGYGLILLRHCFDFMKKNNMPFSKVVSGVKKFYQSACYDIYPQYIYSDNLLVNNRIKLESNINSLYDVKSYSPETDCKSVSLIYRKHNLLIPESGMHSEFYWSRISPRANDGIIYLTAKQGSTIIGFLETMPLSYYAEDLLSVNVFVEPVALDCIPKLLTGMLYQLEKTRFKRTVITINGGHFPYLNDHLPPPVWQSNLMFKLIDLSEIVIRLIPLWSSRLKKSTKSFKGGLNIECMGQSVFVKINQEKHAPSILKTEHDLRNSYINHIFSRSDITYLPLTQQSLFSLLLNPVGLSNILNDKTLNLDQMDMNLIQVIFQRDRF